jgi:hypothetical protein
VQDAEARINILRQRAGLIQDTPNTTHQTLSSSEPSSSAVAGPSSSGKHINLFEDIEEHAAALAARASKKSAAIPEADRGVALAPSKKDLSPWYSTKKGEYETDEKDGKRCVFRFLLLSARRYMLIEIVQCYTVGCEIIRASLEQIRLLRYPLISSAQRNHNLHPCADLSHLILHQLPQRTRRKEHFSPPASHANPPNAPVRKRLYDASKLSALSLRRRVLFTVVGMQICIIERR